jgi:hypothetical protein
LARKPKLVAHLEFVHKARPALSLIVTQHAYGDLRGREFRQVQERIGTGRFAVADGDAHMRPRLPFEPGTGNVLENKFPDPVGLIGDLDDGVCGVLQLYISAFRDVISHIKYRASLPGRQVPEAHRICRAAVEKAGNVRKSAGGFSRFEHVLHRTRSALSGTEKQFLALAYCLCREQEHLLPDAPTGAIQPSIIKGDRRDNSSS